MTLEGSALAVSILVAVMLMAWAVSYLYGWKMIEETGLVASQIAIAAIINLFLWACAIFGWFLYAFNQSKALFIGGLVLSSGLFAVSEAALLTVLIVRRKTWLVVFRSRSSEEHASEETYREHLSSRR